MKLFIRLTLSLVILLFFTAANAVTKTWTGAISTDWATAGNWNTSGVPGSADAVVIPNVAVQPTISTGTWPITSLTIQTGATLTQNGGTVTVSGATSITGIYSQSSGTYLSGGTLTINSGGILNQSVSGIIHMATTIGATPSDAIVISANGSVSQSGGTVSTLDITIASGSPAGTYTQTGGLFEVYQDVINTGIFIATQGTINFKGDGSNSVDYTGTCQFFNFIIDFDIDPNFGKTGSPNLLIAGDFTTNHTSVHYFPPGCTWTFNGTGDQTISSAVGAAALFGNLVINKSGGTVTLLNNANVGTTTTVSNGTFDISTFTSNRTAAGGTLTVSAGATLKLGGASGGQTGSNFPLNFTTISLATGSIVEYNGSNAITQTVYGTTYSNLHLINSSGSGTANKITTANITVNGNLTINSGVLLTPGAANTIGGTGTLIGYGTAQVTRTAATPDFLSQYTISGKTLVNLTVDYFATAAQTVNALNYGNLTVSGARTTASVTYANTSPIRLWWVFNPIATYTSGGNIVTGTTFEFQGTSAQNIPAFTFNNLIINNTSTGATLSGNVSVSGTLTLSTGKFVIPTAYTLNITSGNAISGSGFDATKHIVTEVNTSTGAKGFLRVGNIAGASSYTFPVGNGTYYLPVILNPTAVFDFSVCAFPGVTTNGEPNGTAHTAALKAKEVDAIWYINKNSGSGSADLYVSWPAALEGSTFQTYADNEIGISHYDGVSWDIALGTGSQAANTATRGGVSSFSPFGVGKAGSPLPLKLSSIKASEKSNGIQIDWSTYTENNIMHYEIERSSNGQQFNTSGRVNATGNSNSKIDYTWMDISPLKGNNFYRIKAVEPDGKINYSVIVKVNTANINTGLVISPNPIKSLQVSLQLSNLKQGIYTLIVFNSAGQPIYNELLNHEGGSISQSLQLPGAIKRGVYNLQIRSKELSLQKMFVIE